MKLGIDIGGTHTDGALLYKDQVLKTLKLSTDDNNLSKTILTLCHKLIQDYNPQEVEEITLSTTLATNTIVNNDYKRTGLLLIPGPGLKQERPEFTTETISGYINHRGQEVEEINKEEVIAAVDNLLATGVKNIAICGKFSTRNPKHELKSRAIIEDNFPNLKTISLSHQLTSRLNFPRRQVTTYFNSALYEVQQEFINNIRSGFTELGLKAPLYLLKADGGTMSLKEAEKTPIETVNSGPSASIMGILALTQPEENTLGLDIGGTTTDISFFINQEPLLKPEGIAINNYHSSIRGLYNYSIGCGGDSVIELKDGSLKIGPQRRGPAAALSGNYPTPTDALIVLGRLELGTRKKAYQSLQPLAKQLELSVEAVAHKIIQHFCQKIKNKVLEIINSLQSQTVYTINELLTDYNLDLNHLVGIGGPAEALIPELAKHLDLRYTVPKEAKTANAIGAAAARRTKECTLYADTSQGYYHIPQFQEEREISSDFDLSRAKETACKQLIDAGYTKSEIEIINTESFNLVRGFRTIGQILEVTAQVKPGFA